MHTILLVLLVLLQVLAAFAQLLLHWNERNKMKELGHTRACSLPLYPSVWSLLICKMQYRVHMHD